MVETGLEASPTGRGQQDESQLGPPCSLEAASGQGHQRQGTALGYIISKISLCSGSQNFRRGVLPWLSQPCVSKAQMSSGFPHYPDRSRH